MFRLIAEAYEVLSSPESRRQYDAPQSDGSTTKTDLTYTRSSTENNGFYENATEAQSPPKTASRRK